ncbi:hypothetical protein OSS47_00615 [Pseudomonas citronellolis]|uniref:hypothetical protein n=1 Tax=Pseudomonas citronellolis TaxID=53408 RepID=UPI00226E5A9D|nr:hypothetical protein [Pseudomonas citronellolis]WAB92517.1 hypothetical protein OSS47_00615 [Pseudomonas citronellolis]
MSASIENPAWPPVIPFDAADGESGPGVVLVVVVLVAIVEVLDPRVVRAVLRQVVLSTSRCRRPKPISGATARGLPGQCPVVPLVRVAVALWASGTTRIKIALM